MAGFIPDVFDVNINIDDSDIYKIAFATLLAIAAFHLFKK
jgi:hypothetical protein